MKNSSALTVVASGSPMSIISMEREDDSRASPPSAVNTLSRTTAPSETLGRSDVSSQPSATDAKGPVSGKEATEAE